MKSNKRFLIFSVLILCATIFSSCLSIDRNIIVKKDGSGSEEMTITFNKIFYETMSAMTMLMDSSRVQGFMDSLYSDQVFINETREKIQANPGINLIDISSHKNEDLSNSFTIKYEFDSLYRIGSSAFTKFGSKEDTNTNSKDNSLTEIVFNIEGENVLFKYNYLKDGKNTDINVNDSLTTDLNIKVADMFKDGKISFKIQFPYEIISSNADSTNGNILIWNHSLSETIEKGNMNMEAVLKNDQ